MDDPRTAGAGRDEAREPERLRSVEAALDTLRDTTATLEREVALIRADLERLRQESERAAGSRRP